MSARIHVVAALIVVAFLGGASFGAAQPASAQNAAPPQAGPETQKPLNPAEVQSLIDGYVVMQAQKALDLSDAQFPQFITRLRILQNTRRAAQRQRAQLMQEMARLTNPNSPAPDEAQLREKLKAWSDLETKSAADLHKAYENVDQVLDLRQQVRFRVFLDQVERRMLDIMMRARAQTPPAARGGGAGRQ